MARVVMAGEGRHPCVVIAGEGPPSMTSLLAARKVVDAGLRQHDDVSGARVAPAGDIWHGCPAIPGEIRALPCAAVMIGASTPRAHRALDAPAAEPLPPA